MCGANFQNVRILNFTVKCEFCFQNIDWRGTSQNNLKIIFQFDSFEVINSASMYDRMYGADAAEFLRDLAGSCVCDILLIYIYSFF